MLRKDSTLDMDRPRYYSQFWIDVASGKRDGSAGRVAEAEPEDVEPEDVEPEDFEPEPEPIVRPVAKPKPAKAPEKKPEPARLTSLADLANIDELMRSSAEMDTAEIPDIETGEMDDLAPFGQEPEAAAAEPETAFDELEEVPLSSVDEEEYGDMDYDEDEEEDEWGGGRRQSKPHKQQRPSRRDRGSKPY
jgi:hypothetical protein